MSLPTLFVIIENLLVCFLEWTFRWTSGVLVSSLASYLMLT